MGSEELFVYLDGLRVKNNHSTSLHVHLSGSQMF